MNPSVGLPREIKWLRLGGLAMLVVALGLLGYFEDVAGARWLDSPTVANAIPAIITFFVAGNVGGLGLALLLSGLQNLSLLRNPLARRALLVRVAASNLMLLCFLFVAVTDSTGFDQQMDADLRFAVGGLVAYGLFLYTTRTSIVLYRSSWKYLAPSADELMLRDSRPPVVYLRSFTSDNQIHILGGRFSRLYKMLHYTAAVSPEQELAWIMSRIGPVVAIGRPGERLPQLGAARTYVDDDRWKDTITGLMARAALVVIRAGDTANLWWEIEQATARIPRQRVVIVALGTKERWLDFHRRLTETFGPASLVDDEPTSPQLLWLKRVMMPGRAQGSVIYFDSSGAMFERQLVFSISVRSLVTNVLSPHGAMLRAALEPVIKSKGIPTGRTSRSQTAVVLLAFLGGMFGLHHFYLGNHRKGIWSCVFCWTLVPFVLGLIDSVRFALLDDTQFRLASRIA